MVLSTNFSGKERARNWHGNLYRQRLGVRRASTKHMGVDEGFYKLCALFKLLPVIVAAYLAPCGLLLKEHRGISREASGPVRIGVSAVWAAAGLGVGSGGTSKAPALFPK